MNKKSFLSMLLVTIVVCGLSFASSLFVVPVQAATDVNGIIYTDTTWTQAGSPYTFTGPVAVNASTTLTIQAGVTVNIGSWYLQVNGTLIAISASNNPIYINSNTNSGSYQITFTPLSSSWNEQTATGCILQNTILTCVPIDIENASPKIDSNIMTFNNSNVYNNGGIKVAGGSPIISNNTVTFKGNGFQGFGIIVDSGSPIILDNTITGVNCFVGDGIESAGNASIFGNSISGWACGIESTNDTIGENLIYSNIPVSISPVTGCGISVGTYSLVQNNTVTDNPEGIVINQPSSVISYNNLFGNQYNAVTKSAANIDAIYNWWGTTDTQAINQTIYDYKINFNLGNVSFVPFLGSPSNQAPTFVNASASNGGSIAPSGVVRVNSGGSQTFDVTADTGYYILDVLVNGTSVGAVSSYTVQNVQGATAFSATFTASILEFPTWIIPSLLITTLIAAGLLTYFKKRKH